ncbi:alpha/beta hydrolase [Clostridium sp. CF012]|uniref:alpha/beta hydrolase n=1 Tax=Clostridium sp. CF012 TaxID=2843319 RepID=UPI001C0D668F|nr:alpha/beta hydrolase [Clostridium sp. CF012]MBU3144885.1 alpha/beta hydrolase [Clostridium sp. CF012]
MNNPEIFSFVTEENIELTLNLYRAQKYRRNITIIYFHGGGLLYGVRDDLPQIYIDKFLNSGYDLLALDYPLAPESKIDIILKSSYEEILYYLKNHEVVFELTNKKYVLFGRSSGAYLCFMMCDMLIENDDLMPMAIISLYGYARLDEDQFNTPSKFYNKLPKLSSKSLEKFISDTPVTYCPINLRFSLYIKARQEGTWVKDICKEENPTKYSLDYEKLKSFPPTILTASTLDPDVPYRISKTLRNLIPNSHLITIYGEVHDFDRDINNDSGILTYEEIIKWLEDII